MGVGEPEEEVMVAPLKTFAQILAAEVQIARNCQELERFAEQARKGPNEPFRPNYDWYGKVYSSYQSVQKEEIEQLRTKAEIVLVQDFYEIPTVVMLVDLLGNVRTRRMDLTGKSYGKVE